MAVFVVSSDWRFKEKFKQHFNPSMVHQFTSPARVLAALNEQRPQLLVVDSRLRQGTAAELLQALKERDISCQILLCTEEGKLPFRLRPSETLRIVDRTTLNIGDVYDYLECPLSDLTKRTALPCGLIGESAVMADLRRNLFKLGQKECSVHLHGETGTGKEVAAQYLHRLKFPYRKIVAINCSLLSDTLGNSMFFGHTKGAFTDGKSELSGLVHEANGTTLFLDEVENLSLRFQAHLLRLLESGHYRRYGDTTLHTSTFRLITASNVELESLVQQDQMRKDFLYRISDVIVLMPPLRTHREDIPLLCSHYLKRLGCEDLTVDEESLALLQSHSWPGNVRELFSTLKRAMFAGTEGGILRISEEDLMLDRTFSWTM
jgi:DNA-binding NtrC family response regulator